MDMPAACMLLPAAGEKGVNNLLVGISMIYLRAFYISVFHALSSPPTMMTLLELLLLQQQE
eukprot:scaffold3611_cov154-Skeletonema_marinoi.AAC.4